MDLEWLNVLCEDFDRARSLTICLMAKYNEWDQLVTLRCYPDDYCDSDVSGFKADYQITELLRKCTDLPVNQGNLEDKAVEAFYETEKQCHATNLFLKPYINVIVDGDWYLGSSYDNVVQDTVLRCRSIIKKVLGPLPDDLHPKFSSGSTYRDRQFISPMDKMSSRPTVTHEAYSVIHSNWETTLWCVGLTSELPHRSAPEILRGNRFTTVPKDATKLRGICIEPSLNVVYQLSVGSNIRRRLLSHGIDLIRGQSLHQSLVRDGSRSRDIGTVDLSSASDTVSYDLVRLLLPGDWFDLLDCLRSEFTLLPDGTQWKNHKFSSMGCGFTFELETLIFYAICLASGSPSNETYVYGDDIIVPIEHTGKLLQNLRLFGFTPNERKTFVTDTAFRESCGADYFNGVYVRPFYLKEINIEGPPGWIALANGLNRMVGPDCDRYSGLGLYSRSWYRCLSNIPISISKRCRGPSSLGDSVIHDVRWKERSKCRDGIYTVIGICPIYSKSARSSYDRKHWTRDSIVAAAVEGYLYGSGDSVLQRRDGTYYAISGDFQKARQEPTGYRLQKIVVSTGISTRFTERLDTFLGGGTSVKR